jgi:hypothetical protein
VRLARHHDGVDVGELPDERGRLETVRRIEPEIRAHPGAQSFGLSDVQHGSLGVFPEIDAGRLREMGDLGCDLFVGTHADGCSLCSVPFSTERTPHEI